MHRESGGGIRIFLSEGESLDSGLGVTRHTKTSAGLFPGDVAFHMHVYACTLRYIHIYKPLPCV